MDISYILNQLGEERQDYLHSVTPPIFQTAMFSSKSVAEMRELLRQEAHRPFYTRGNNPTTDILRKKVAALEKAEDALVFASGSAAIAAAVMVHLKAGDHVVCVQKPYSWTNKLLEVFLPRFNVHCTFVDGTDPKNYEKALRPSTKLFYMESPNSWTFDLQDIEQVVSIAKKHGLITVIDNSYATPVFQNPIEMGVDLVVHSATKYMAGHSDTVAGVLCGSHEMIQKIFASEYMALGGIISPFNAWLLMRGLRTLPLRMEKYAENTPKVIDFLEQHPRIEKVYYPFSPSHPQYELAKKQMKGGSGMFSIQIRADQMAEVEKVCDALKYFLLAVSWGAYESLIFPACTLYASEIYKTPDLPWNMVRVSLGLEDPEVLIADWDQALKEG